MAWVPIVAVVVGAILSGILSLLTGMVLAGQNEIRTHLAKLNGSVEKSQDKLLAHMTQNGIHESAVARIDERMSGLLKIIEAAHMRMDRMMLETKDRLDSFQKTGCGYEHPHEHSKNA